MLLGVCEMCNEWMLSITGLNFVEVNVDLVKFRTAKE
jgi:hypothetical protein